MTTTTNPTIKEGMAEILNANGEVFYNPGLRSIRYGKEIENNDQNLVIFANDFDKDAVENIKANIKLNNLEHIIEPSLGDCNFIMYKAMNENLKYDVVDLDPYGSASPFIDAAVQSVNDGGLLCVTCTDMQVLAGGQTEANFTKYGGINLTTTPYCHEMGLRSLLHCIQTSASRYKKYITPLLSCSIDFYLRVFVKISLGAAETKKAVCKTSMIYHCHSCKSFTTSSLGKRIDTGKGFKYTTNKLPVDSKCIECGSSITVAGPLYSGPLHDVTFVKKMIDHVKNNPKKFGTEVRMTGMLTLISEELEDPFYYAIDKLCQVVHCSTPALKLVTSALLNQGYKFSASHCLSGSLKTNAPSTVLWDVIRSHSKLTKSREAKEGEIVMKNILSKDVKVQADFSIHKDCESQSRKFKLVRYQENPTPNWGPGSRAKGKKRKAEDI
ncbi:tRNA methyltransferase 1 [Clydaea vesicula]|uniref:tRNA (guanine(26)-N(2))-dimethyltransferase n=1 Tax=Clydaea vesicula TaxID=447962 RepID=A0AAD5TZA1_9FUNG|nr:tRNA methyltransferase 1 [Clydaea vesicula]